MIEKSIVSRHLIKNENYDLALTPSDLAFTMIKTYDLSARNPTPNHKATDATYSCLPNRNGNYHTEQVLIMAVHLNKYSYHILQVL